MVARAVSELGAPELVSAYHEYACLHEIYQQAGEQIKAATTPEEVLAAYRQLNPQAVQEEQEEGVIGL